MSSLSLVAKQIGTNKFMKTISTLGMCLYSRIVKKLAEVPRSMIAITGRIVKTLKYPNSKIIEPSLNKVDVTKNPTKSNLAREA